MVNPNWAQHAFSPGDPTQQYPVSLQPQSTWREYTISCSPGSSHKTHFDQSHGTRELQELGPGQEVLFRSPTDDEYIPGTIVNKATEAPQLCHRGPKQTITSNERTYKAYPPKYPSWQNPKTTTDKA